MPALQSAVDLNRRQRELSARALVAARRLRGDLPRLVGVVTAFQMLAADNVVTAVPLMLDEQGIDSEPEAETMPRALAGTASNGYPLAAMLALVHGPDVPAYKFDRMVLTQVADTGRQAGVLQAAVTPTVTGYERHVNPGACSRCIILAGKYFRLNRGFERHPSCFCVHVPTNVRVAEELNSDDPVAYFNGLSRAEQDRVFTKGGAELIRNAPAEQMQYAMGRTVNTRWGFRMPQRIDASNRKMPETLVARANGDRDVLLRLMRAHGYIK